MLGNTTISDRSVYALVNYAPHNQGITREEATIILVPKNWRYAVERDFSEWKQTP